MAGLTKRVRRARRMWPVAALLAGAVLVGGCGGASGGPSTLGGDVSGGDGGGGGQGGTLTVAVASPTPTVDPALLTANPSYLWMAELAYDPLLWFAPDGSFKPGLATEWEYVGSGSRRFRLTLRSGVKFADGTPVDAEAVAASLRYSFKTGTTPLRAPGFRTARATGQSSVEISCSSACHSLPVLLSQNGLAGSIISPAGLRDTKRLGTQTFGAGPYVLNGGETVAGDHYTYDANPRYRNRSAVHYKRVVVRIVGDPNARVSSLTSGQADIIDYVPAELAKSVNTGANKLLPQPSGTVEMIFRDRTGRRHEGDPAGAKYNPPLAKVLVRQALSYAVDRKAITEGLGYGYFSPSVQWTAKGSGAYDPALESMYPYDPDKAKALLAQAGHPNGFTLDVVTQKNNHADQWALAVAEYWEKIGVKVRLTTAPDVNVYYEAAQKSPVLFARYGAGSLPYSLEAVDYFGDGGAFSAYETEPAMRSMIARAAEAPPEQTREIYLAINRRAVEQALSVGIAQFSYLYAYNAQKVNIPPLIEASEAGQLTNVAPILTNVTPK